MAEETTRITIKLPANVNSQVEDDQYTAQKAGKKRPSKNSIIIKILEDHYKSKIQL